MRVTGVLGMALLLGCGSNGAAKGPVDGAAPADGGSPADAAGGHDAGLLDAGTNLALHVEGNQLVRNGKPFRVLGVNHSGTEFACIQNNGIFDGPSDASLATAIQSWHANTVRMGLNEDCWLAINGAPVQYSGTAYQSAVQTFAQMLVAHGFVVILDLHWSGAGTTQATGQQPMADADHSIEFWKEVAMAFQGTSDVVFDLYNEPYIDTSNAMTQDPWGCWLSGCTITSGAWKTAGMQDLVTAVRGTGATNVLMAGGLAYANDLSGWLTHMPSDPLKQLAASFHLYNFNVCIAQSCWDQDIAPLAAQVPVITGELGENDCAHGFIDTYMAWADGKGVSYNGWTFNTWDCKSGPALITDYTGTPTAFGAGLQAHLMTVSP